MANLQSGSSCRHLCVVLGCCHRCHQRKTVSAAAPAALCFMRRPHMRSANSVIPEHAFAKTLPVSAKVNISCTFASESFSLPMPFVVNSRNKTEHDASAHAAKSAITFKQVARDDHMLQHQVLQSCNPAEMCSHSTANTSGENAIENSPCHTISSSSTQAQSGSAQPSQSISPS